MTMVLVDKYLHRSPFALEGMALEMPDLIEEHPNRVPFHGILTRLDEPSTRPPNGSGGHKVLIPSAVAEAALPSLLGMPVDCSVNMRDHNKRIVVGMITGADIQGPNLVVSGHLLAKNFPEEVAEIQSKKSQLGMSYEISNVEVEDVNAPVWTLTGLQFTGAAILLKSAAAYEHTAIAARAEEEDEMAGAVETLDKLDKKLDAITGKLRTLEAAREDEDDAAAAKQEEEAQAHLEAAKRASAQALQAREEDDEEDAARHEEEAAKSRQAASVARLAAAKRHEEAATRLRAAGDKEEDAAAKEEAQTAAKHHEEEAKRLQAEDEKAKAEDEEARAELAAMGVQHVDKEHALWEKVCAMMLRAAMAEQSAATPDKKKSEEEMLRTLVKAMSFMPGMMDAMKASKAHPDEEEDKKLIREFLRRGNDQKASSTSTLESNRRMRRMEAAMELLTDQVSKAVGLITDMVSHQRGLATDANQGANGGTAQRKTMHATGEERWQGKYDDVGTEKKQGRMTEVELNAALDAAGVTDAVKRLAAKINYQQMGTLA